MSIAKHDAIKGALRLRGTCLADVAKALNVRSTTITVVSKGYRRSQRIETALAAALGMTHEQLWPERNPIVSGPATPAAQPPVSRRTEIQRRSNEKQLKE